MWTDIYAILCNVNCSFFSIAGKLLESSKPEYATCRSLLRSGLASSLRVNIRAVSWKPSGIVHSSILYLLFQAPLLRLTSKCLYIPVFPFRTLFSNLLFNSVSSRIFWKETWYQNSCFLDQTPAISSPLFYILVHVLLT